jgi:acyl-CoA reductase-like NAD-dependent aldehyde dehydrogenase
MSLNQTEDAISRETRSRANEVRTYKYCAGGEWRSATAGRTFDVHQPFGGQLYAKVAAGGAEDARIAVQAAADALPAWSQTTPAERASLLLKAGEIVKRRRAEIAEVLARETGSTISFATFQQDLVAATLQQSAGWVFLPKGEVLQTNQPGLHSVGIPRPLGVVASLTPWNGANVLSWRAVISPARTCQGFMGCRPMGQDRQDAEHTARSCFAWLRHLQREGKV